MEKTQDSEVSHRWKSERSASYCGQCSGKELHLELKHLRWEEVRRMKRLVPEHIEIDGDISHAFWELCRLGSCMWE